jgi:hypothetical protein
MTWREVLAAKGWEPFGVGDSRECWRCPHDPEEWWYLHMTQLRSGRYCFSLMHGSHLFTDLGQDAALATDELAFAALMAKPIGPGRVTVGVLLGVA